MNPLFILGCGIGLFISLIVSLLISFIPWEYVFVLVSSFISLITYHRGKIKSYLNALLIKWMITIMFQKAADEVNKSSLTIDKNVATINYSYNKKEYKFYLPYDSIAAKIRSKRVYAVMEDSQEINITQQPGLPYLLTCQDLNALRIEVRGRDQTVLKTYQNDENIIL